MAINDLWRQEIASRQPFSVYIFLSPKLGVCSNKTQEEGKHGKISVTGGNLQVL